MVLKEFEAFLFLNLHLREVPMEHKLGRLFTRAHSGREMPSH